MPVIVRMTNATKEMPPRQYSGYQYQIVFSSYFSAWLRGTCRWSVSTSFRVRSDHGAMGNRSLTQPNRVRFACRNRLTSACRRVIESPAIRGIPLGVAAVLGIVDPHELGAAELGRNAGKRPRCGSVHVPRADVRHGCGRRMDVVLQGDGIVLGVVAGAPDRVLRIRQAGDRVRRILRAGPSNPRVPPVPLRDRLNMP